jgi:hypothetical protein
MRPSSFPPRGLFRDFGTAVNDGLISRPFGHCRGSPVARRHRWMRRSRKKWRFTLMLGRRKSGFRGTSAMTPPACPGNPSPFLSISGPTWNSDNFGNFFAIFEGFSPTTAHGGSVRQMCGQPNSEVETGNPAPVWTSSRSQPRLAKSAHGRTGGTRVGIETGGGHRFTGFLLVRK